MSGFLFIIIGVGGIGGNVARDLPKLLTGWRRDYKIMLVDGDTVEEKNCVRQPYQKQDIGLNKARALAKKINSFYNVDCLFLDKYITNNELDVICDKYSKYIPVFIGCVDNDATRKLIQMTYLKQKDAALIDGANSEYEGNVYDSKIIDGVRKGPIRSEYYQLDDDINPGLKGCEELAAKGATQYLVTNNKVASVILEHIHAMITEFSAEGVTVIERFKTLHC
jgi:molybdopterin/thiamine biosynthesis adenylyltransferase